MVRVLALMVTDLTCNHCHAEASVPSDSGVFNDFSEPEEHAPEPEEHVLGLFSVHSLTSFGVDAGLRSEFGSTWGELHSKLLHRGSHGLWQPAWRRLRLPSRRRCNRNAELAPS
jgi:hypothetical protein